MGSDALLGAFDKRQTMPVFNQVPQIPCQPRFEKMPDNRMSCTVFAIILLNLLYTLFMAVSVGLTMPEHMPFTFRGYMSYRGFAHLPVIVLWSIALCLSKKVANVYLFLLGCCQALLGLGLILYMNQQLALSDYSLNREQMLSLVVPVFLGIATMIVVRCQH